MVNDYKPGFSIINIYSEIQTCIQITTTPAATKPPIKTTTTNTTTLTANQILTTINSHRQSEYNIYGANLLVVGIVFFCVLLLFAIIVVMVVIRKHRKSIEEQSKLNAMKSVSIDQENPGKM